MRADLNVMEVLVQDLMTAGSIPVFLSKTSNSSMFGVCAPIQ